MGWDDDRVELLKKMWADGLSAPQIAKQLGGVTRNAVIGKVHRLGLSGRATPAKPQVVHATRPRPTPPPRQIAPPVCQPLPDLCGVNEAPGTATLLTLGAHMCKWPIGDPRDAAFTFCGRRAEDGRVYCHGHVQVSYVPLGKPRPTWSEERRAQAAIRARMMNRERQARKAVA
jgi:GcrA cell cycle regulator